VMMREDSTGGWVPLGGGGLSHVAVRKRKIQHEDDPPCKHEYLIYGKRINDQKVVMSCTIKKDFQYNRVMPTFHHWKTGNLKYGLTFQTAADARAFDKGVKMAVDDLLSGLSSPLSPVVQLNRDVEEESEVFMQLELPLERDSASSGASSPASPQARAPLLEELSPGSESQARLQLPGLQRSRTITGAPSRLTSRPQPRPPGLPTADTGPLGDNIYEWLQTCNKSEKIPLRTRISEERMEKLENLDKIADRAKSEVKNFDKDFVSLRYNIALGGPGELAGEDAVFGDILGSDAYVKLDILPVEPQYHYPSLDTAAQPSKGTLGKVAGVEEGRKAESGPGRRLKLPSPTNKKKQSKDKRKKYKKDPKKPAGRLLQERCVHCHQLYSEAENNAGSCRYSPDLIKQGVECISCIACAKCLLYHCHYEDENFTDEDICTCDNSDGQLGKRWLGLSLLAVLVPCLCLYPLLTACHSCGRACRLCGGRHVPS